MIMIRNVFVFLARGQETHDAGSRSIFQFVLPVDAFAELFGNGCGVCGRCSGWSSDEESLVEDFVQPRPSDIREPPPYKPFKARCCGPMPEKKTEGDNQGTRATAKTETEGDDQSPHATQKTETAGHDQSPHATQTTETAGHDQEGHENSQSSHGTLSANTLRLGNAGQGDTSDEEKHWADHRRHQRRQREYGVDDQGGEGSSDDEHSGDDEHSEDEEELAEKRDEDVDNRPRQEAHASPHGSETLLRTPIAAVRPHSQLETPTAPPRKRRASFAEPEGKKPATEEAVFAAPE